MVFASTSLSHLCLKYSLIIFASFLDNQQCVDYLFSVIPAATDTSLKGTLDRPEWCQFHNAFADKARNCRQPCSYASERMTAMGQWTFPSFGTPRNPV